MEGDIHGGLGLGLGLGLHTKHIYNSFTPTPSSGEDESDGRTMDMIYPVAPAENSTGDQDSTWGDDITTVRAVSLCVVCVVSVHMYVCVCMFMCVYVQPDVLKLKKKIYV